MSLAIQGRQPKSTWADIPWGCAQGLQDNGILSRFPYFVVVCKCLSTNSKPEVNYEVAHMGKEVVTPIFTCQNLCHLERLAMAREWQGSGLGLEGLPWALSLAASYRINISQKNLVWGFSIHPCKGYQGTHLLFQKTWWAVGIEDRCWPARPVGGEPPAYPLGDNLRPHETITDAVTEDVALQKPHRIYGKQCTFKFLLYFWIEKYSLLQSLSEDIRKNNWGQFWVNTCNRRTFLFVVNLFSFSICCFQIKG